MIAEIEKRKMLVGYYHLKVVVVIYVFPIINRQITCKNFLIFSLKEVETTCTQAHRGGEKRRTGMFIIKYIIHLFYIQY
jgi:hypothetical protein